MFLDKADAGNEETDLRFTKKKKLFSWQNIWNRRQIAVVLKEKLADQEEVLRLGVSLIYHYFSNKWNPCHGSTNSWPRNLRAALQKYFRFHWNCKLLRVEAKNIMLNCEIYFSLFSETRHTILKLFSQHNLRKSLGKKFGRVPQCLQSCSCRKELFRNE